ncbi:hypothetical protein QWZ10_20035 [Paracoccus cavernae]|uniref:Excinuclease ABC subunit A n=1 Tax=Paracoccus cavernae TaxID=1571207 RepID=A0ABT8DAJ8_9RHOB|nr:hypothetical protein [Paracoccus cavernae]
MNRTASLILAAALGAVSSAPSFADPGNGRGNGKGNGARHSHDRGPERDHRNRARYVADCPPGLAKKDPPCIPPGQVGKRYGTRIGDTLRIGDYRLIRDRDRYDLDYRRGWDYYRDDERVYRIDRDTRKILAVINLIDAFF